jgi:uncharacterized protein YndB with AHSA1/START domain
MATYDASIEIDATPADIFPFLVEPERLKRWVGGFVEARPLTDGPVGPGSRSIDVIRENGREMELHTEITRYEPPNAVFVAIRAGGMDAISEYQLEPRDAGTIVRHSQRVRYSGVLRLVGPFVGGVVRRKMREDLERLKAAVERS